MYVKERCHQHNQCVCWDASHLFDKISRFLDKWPFALFFLYLAQCVIVIIFARGPSVIMNVPKMAWHLMLQLAATITRMIEGRHYSVILVGKRIIAEARQYFAELGRNPRAAYGDLVRGHVQLACGTDLPFEALTAAETHPDCPRRNDDAGISLTTGAINLGFRGKHVVIKHHYLVSLPNFTMAASLMILTNQFTCHCRGSPLPAKMTSMTRPWCSTSRTSQRTRM